MCWLICISKNQSAETTVRRSPGQILQAKVGQQDSQSARLHSRALHGVFQASLLPCSKSTTEMSILLWICNLLPETLLLVKDQVMDLVMVTETDNEKRIYQTSLRQHKKMLFCTSCIVNHNQTSKSAREKTAEVNLSIGSADWSQLITLFCQYLCSRKWNVGKIQIREGIYQKYKKKWHDTMAETRSKSKCQKQNMQYALWPRPEDKFLWSSCLRTHWSGRVHFLAGWRWWRLHKRKKTLIATTSTVAQGNENGQLNVHTR